MVGHNSLAGGGTEHVTECHSSCRDSCVLDEREMESNCAKTHQHTSEKIERVLNFDDPVHTPATSAQEIDAPKNDAQHPLTQSYLVAYKRALSEKELQFSKMSAQNYTSDISSAGGSSDSSLELSCHGVRGSMLSSFSADVTSDESSLLFPQTSRDEERGAVSLAESVWEEDAREGGCVDGDRDGSGGWAGRRAGGGDLRTAYVRSNREDEIFRASLMLASICEEMMHELHEVQLDLLQGNTHRVQQTHDTDQCDTSSDAKIYEVLLYSLFISISAHDMHTRARTLQHAHAHAHAHTRTHLHEVASNTHANLHDDDCFDYYSWRNKVVIALGTLSSLLT